MVPFHGVPAAGCRAADGRRGLNETSPRCYSESSTSPSSAAPMPSEVVVAADGSARRRAPPRARTPPAQCRRRRRRHQAGRSAGPGKRIRPGPAPVRGRTTLRDAARAPRSGRHRSRGRSIPATLSQRTPSRAAGQWSRIQRYLASVRPASREAQRGGEAAEFLAALRLGGAALSCHAIPGPPAPVGVEQRSGFRDAGDTDRDDATRFGVRRARHAPGDGGDDEVVGVELLSRLDPAPRRRARPVAISRPSVSNAAASIAVVPALRPRTRSVTTPPCRRRGRAAGAERLDVAPQLAFAARVSESTTEPRANGSSPPPVASVPLPATPTSTENPGSSALPPRETLGAEVRIGRLGKRPRGAASPASRSPSQAGAVQRRQRPVPAEVQVSVVLAELEPVPLEQDREVGRLLELDEQDPGADRVRRAGRDEDRVAGADGDSCIAPSMAAPSWARIHACTCRAKRRENPTWGRPRDRPPYDPCSVLP